MSRHKVQVLHVKRCGSNRALLLPLHERLSSRHEKQARALAPERQICPQESISYDKLKRKCQRVVC